MIRGPGRSPQSPELCLQCHILSVTMIQGRGGGLAAVGSWLVHAELRVVDVSQVPNLCQCL